MDPIRYRTPEELNALVKNDYKGLKTFFSQMKRVKPKDLDHAFFVLHQKAFNQFDCLNCANCCSSISPIVTDKDIDRLAKYLRVRPAELIARYLHLDEEHDYVFNQTPCPFLLPDRYCSVYEYRPKACREYPHTDRKKMHQIIGLTMKNCSVCPVVYAIVDEMQKTQ